MHTFLPFESFEETATVLDNIRLNSQLNEILVILRSLTGVYEPNPRTGISGWAEHTVAKLWVGHELQLARLAKAIAYEQLVKRALPKTISVLVSTEKRKQSYNNWKAVVTKMEEDGYPTKKPSLLGNKDFHSGFRAWLLYKDIQAVTFKTWKRGGYIDHACTRNLLPRKASWKRESYIAIWERFGMPEAKWYSQFKWTEDPSDMFVFYSEDKVPQMEKEIRRKKERPIPTYLMKYRKDYVKHTSVNT